MAFHLTHTRVFFQQFVKNWCYYNQNNRGGTKTMFSLRYKGRLVKKLENLNKYGPFFIIFPLPVMLKFTVHITAVHLFTCVAKAVTSRLSREYHRHQTYCDALKNSFFPRTIPHWNSLPPSVASAQSTEEFRALLI